jgi:hypothetical protein
MTVEQYKKSPAENYYYSESEWARLGCGALPTERDRSKQHLDACAKGNPMVDGKAVKGYN